MPERVRGRRAAAHRSRQGRSARSGRHRRADLGASRALHRVLRRPVVRRRRIGLQGAEGRARRVGRRAVRQRADLRDIESPPSAARVYERQRDIQASAGRRDSSGRGRRGEDLAVGALRPLGQLLSVQAGRLSDDRRPLAPALRLRRRRSGSGARRRTRLGAGARFALRPGCMAVRARSRGPQGERMSGEVTNAAAPAATGRKVTEVAVGVLVRPDGRYLLAQRLIGKPYEGYWEFPGGKLEAGESVEAALARELHEELGIAVTECHRWHMLEHDYPHAYVRLYFCKVTGWTGEPHSREGQAFVWQHLPVDVAPLLPAALPVLELLAREQGDAQQ
ncbi:pyrophosphatase, NUDIX family [Burkholderia pseudomallei 1710b]|nr:pyrophosphatase, NUDIX family [Burkholderia pseudomallei 1710b]